MGRKDWEYVNLPKLLVKRLDKFLETPSAKKMGVSSKSELLRQLINRYLDEQEEFYNNLESIHDFVLGLKDRDHFVLTFNEESQLNDVLLAFLERGVNLNQVSILFISKEEEPSFMQVLSSAYENITSLFNSEDVLVLRAEECYVDGDFSMELAMKNLRYAAESARRKGKSGLNVLGTLPGKLISARKYEEALRIERAFHEAVQRFEIPISVICMYGSLPSEVQELFSECHDLVVKRAVTERQSGLL